MRSRSPSRRGGPITAVRGFDDASPVFDARTALGPASFAVATKLSYWIPRLPVPVIACGGITSSPMPAPVWLSGQLRYNLMPVVWRAPDLLATIAKELAYDSGNATS